MDLVFGCFYKEHLIFVHSKLFLFEPTWIQYQNTENLYWGQGKNEDVWWELKLSSASSPCWSTEFPMQINPSSQYVNGTRSFTQMVFKFGFVA
jgi:hypothetical protein